MTQVILQPSANKNSRKHYRDTIEEPVDLVTYRTVLGVPMFQHLANLFPSGFAPMWGVTPGAADANKKKWDRVELGATVLFTAKGRVYGRGVVAARFQNATLAKRLWGVDDRGDTWEYMYALDSVTAVDIPYAEFNSAVGYKRNNVIQGFTVMDESRSSAFLESFPGIANRVEWPDNPEMVEEAIRSLDGDLERRVQTWQRAEQSALREVLLRGATNGRCELCGRVMTSQFLIAAHIKKRSFCTEAEKRDLRNIGMLNCRFGCDELYERGFIAVDSDWSVISRSSLTDQVARSYVQNNVLSQLSARPDSAIYFAWHREYHGF